MTDFLHIVSLDAPSPPDYGGAIDIYYRIKAIAATGKKIILHYFDYKKERGTGDLGQVCAAIHRYERKQVAAAFPFTEPYIIASRTTHQLIHCLEQDQHPILLEGLHCAGIVPFIRNKERIVLRMHNEEAMYYRHLSATEKNFLKKTYYRMESRLLDRYQFKMNKNLKLACLSSSDIEVFEKKYGFTKAAFIPCFTPWQELSAKEGKGDYCLYHGNLTIAENNEAALWLTKEIFSKNRHRFLIAGKGPSGELRSAVARFPNISLIPDPSIAVIDELIANAQINVLPSMNSTGVKLKLLHALFCGRFCISNSNGVKGTNIARGLSLADDAATWTQLIDSLMEKEFSPEEKEGRKQLLVTYDNQKNAALLNALW